MASLHHHSTTEKELRCGCGVVVVWLWCGCGVIVESLWSDCGVVVALLHNHSTIEKELWSGCAVVVEWLWSGCGVTRLGEGCHLWATVNMTRASFQTQSLALQVIKMYAWETFFERKVTNIRNAELACMRQTALLNAMANSACLLTPYLVSVPLFHDLLVRSCL